MELGLHIASFTWPGGPERLAENLTRVVVAAEDAGLGRVSVMDHLWQIGPLGPPEEPMLEAYTTLGYLAARTSRVEEKWTRWGLAVPLVVLASPYRSFLRPLLDYVDHIQARGDDQMVTIVLPEFLPRKWWQHILHNQTALMVKGALLFRRNLVVADVPYLLKR